MPRTRANPSFESASVRDAAARIEKVIREAVGEAGGDLETQHLHLVFGFSTGHFAVEPLRAQAARETAAEIVRDLAVQGDLVSGYAFEMGLWRQPGAAAESHEDCRDTGAAKAPVEKLFPLTTQAGSTGGHDTERAIVEMAQSVDPSSGAILILFTNRAASITRDPETRPLLGQDGAEYGSTMNHWRRVGATNRSGASLEVSYQVDKPNGDTVPNTLDVVVVVPRAFEAPPLTAPSAASPRGNA